MLAREEDVPESGLSLFKRGATLRRNKSRQTLSSDPGGAPEKKRGCLPDVPGPHDGWMTYCYCITICVPGFLLSTFGVCSLFFIIKKLIFSSYFVCFSAF